MNNNLDDFFGEELDKSANSTNSDSTELIPPDTQLTDIMQFSPKPTQHNKKISVVIICIALVVAMAFGILLGILINSQDTEEGILNEVLDTLRNDYFFDISDEEWQTIIANGGTALLQGVDDYGQLLTPQQSYDLYYGVDSVTYIDGLSFGFGYYTVLGTGIMVISTVYSDSNAFGRLAAGDVVVGLTNLTDIRGNLIMDSNGDTVYTVNLASADYDYVYEVISSAYQATFMVMGDSGVEEVTFTRGTIGSINNTDGFEFVDYYFGIDNTNVSTTIESGRATSTMVYKCLDQLPSNVGYIYISQFSSSTTSDCAEEFYKALTYFSASGKDYLIVDVKGNPGGSVDLVSTIAGMLATDTLLDYSTAQQYGIDQSDNEILTVSMHYKDDSKVVNYYADCLYDTFFDSSDSTVQVVIWTDGSSASASELLTGVLLDYGTGIQMGSTTYGKGIAQTLSFLYDYEDTVTTIDGTEGTWWWSVYYTFAKYYSPLDNNIHGIGYTPSDSYNGLEEYSDLVSAVTSYYS